MFRCCYIRIDSTESQVGTANLTFVVYQSIQIGKTIVADQHDLLSNQLMKFEGKTSTEKGGTHWQTIFFLSSLWAKCNYFCYLCLVFFLLYYCWNYSYSFKRKRKYERQRNPLLKTTIKELERDKKKYFPSFNPWQYQKIRGSYHLTWTTLLINWSKGIRESFRDNTCKDRQIRWKE